MDNQDREKDLARAKVAMGGAHYEDKEKERSLELEKRRIEASITMESSEHKEKRELGEEELKKRREEAMRAMESAEQKAKREAEEKAVTDKAKTAKQLQELREKEQKKNRQTETKKQRLNQEKVDQQREQKDKYREHLEETNQIIQNIAQQEKVEVTPYRTLQTDIKQTITRDNLSMTKIALAEQVKNNYQTKESESSGKKNSRRILIVLSLIFVALGISALVFVFVKDREDTFNIFSTQSIILVDNQIEIIADGKSTSQIKSELVGLISTEPKNESVTGVFITQTPTDKDGNKLPKKELTIEEVFTQFGIVLPLDFLHFLNAKYMIGIYHGPAGDKPFVVLTTKAFANSLDSLLRNESGIIGEILGIADPTIKDKLRFQIFKDRVIKNIDTRMAEAEEGVIALYAFPSHDVLVIGESIETMTKIIDLLRASASNLADN